jgi:hypothetical protein
MTITNIDQIAKLRKYDKPGVIFPKGIRQCVAYIYGMQGVSAHERSVHAKLIDMVKDGYLENMRTDGINMGGMTSIECKAECANLRGQVERELKGDHLHVVQSRYGHDDVTTTQEAIVKLIDPVQEYFSGGKRRSDRSKRYTCHLIWHVCCSPKCKEICTVTIISKENQVRPSLVCRDIQEVYRFLEHLDDAAMRKLERYFRGKGVI